MSIWFIIFATVSVVLDVIALFIIYRYNQLNDIHDDTVEEVDELVEQFSEYSQLLDRVEQSDILIFDPMITDLVNQGKLLKDQIEKADFNLKDVVEEEK